MSLPILTHSPLWIGGGWTMVHVIWVGAVIGVLSWLSRRCMRRAGSELRYAAALFWLVLLAGSPLVIFVSVFRPAPVDVGSVSLPVGRAEAANGGGNADRDRMISARTGRQELVTSGEVEVRRWKLEAIVPYLPVFWLTGSVSALVMMMTGLIGVHRLRRSSEIIIDGEIPRQVQRLARSLRIARRVSIGVCDRLAVPVLVGVIRPLILLPPAALCGWSIEQLEMVLLHELAHLRRWDNLVNISQRVVESLLFFHPVVWWLSRWLRLERELCCDRLVVSRVGEPVAYAEMLVALTGASHQGRQAVLAMADRDVMTRIRRLFNLEDRSMKLSTPEGIGLLGALIVGLSLTLGLHAAQPAPKGESEEWLRQALQTAAGAVNALPREGLEHDFTVETLVNIARAQMKLGDRATALGTLKIAYEAINRLDKEKNGLEILGSLMQLTKYQRELGDVAAAQKTLDRMGRLVDSLDSRSFVEEFVQVPGAKERVPKKVEINAAVRAELLLMIAEEQHALGEVDKAQATCRRVLKVIEPQQGMLKPMALAYIAMNLHKAGDQGGARRIVDQARQLASELSDQAEKERSLAEITMALAETGDFDGAFELVARLDKSGRQRAIERIADSFTEDEPGAVWLPISGIKITIGAPSRRLKDRKVAAVALPKLVQAATEIGDPLIRARTLSTLAHLQAKAGDFASAFPTAQSIPAIKRKDFAGPSDGFYDAIKPATLAIVAQLQFEGGEKQLARERLLHAVTLARTVETAEQKIIAQIVVIRKLIVCNELESARSILAESISLARQQPEPFKSRSLVALTEAQLQAGDCTAAEETLRFIRSFPGLEKVNALNQLADWYQKKGERGRAESLYRQGLECVLSKMPLDAERQMGKAGNPGPVALSSFVDYGLELAPAFLENQRQMSAMFLYASLGQVDEATQVAQSMALGPRNVALGNLAASLARNGQTARAMKLAESIESPDGKLTAYDLVAIAIRDGRTSK